MSESNVSAAAVADEKQVNKEKEEKQKVKRKKSVKSSEGKSKNSNSRKSSNVENGEAEGEVRGAELSSNVIEDEIRNDKNSTEDISGNEILESEVKNSEKVEEENKKNVIMLREMDFRKLAELREAFHLFDINRDGFIDKDDLKFTFTSMGKPNVADELIDQMLSEMSDNGVDFDSFVKIFGYKSVELDPEEELLTALSKWDYHGNGMISEETLKRDLQSWGDKFTENEVEHALEEAPVYKKDGTTMIDYIKFCSNICGLRNVEKTREIEKEAKAYEEEMKSLIN